MIAPRRRACAEWPTPELCCWGSQPWRFDFPSAGDGTARAAGPSPAGTCGWPAIRGWSARGVPRRRPSAAAQGPVRCLEARPRTPAGAAATPPRPPSNAPRRPRQGTRRLRRPPPPPPPCATAGGREQSTQRSSKTSAPPPRQRRAPLSGRTHRQRRRREVGAAHRRSAGPPGRRGSPAERPASADQDHPRVPTPGSVRSKAAPLRSRQGASSQGRRHPQPLLGEATERRRPQARGPAAWRPAPRRRG
mmetsp:Transcript_58410/g.190514  ORF Transcript_58410/g.190514 Transcript_58410/m.190514 type:complete len:248 (-) Transcript_58410:119-862(-)